MNVGQWVVVNTRGDFYSATRIDQITPKLIKTRSWGRRFHQHPRDCVVAVFDRQELAEQMVQAIDDARGSLRDARFKERKRHQEAMDHIAEKQAANIQRVIDRILSAQGIEARQGGDAEGGSVHESPVAEGDAP